MGNLLFSPSGRIGPSAYFKGMMILAVISAVISLTGLVSTGLAIALGFVGFLLIIPFIFLGIKRSHDAGKSGWMVLTHLLLYFGLAYLASLLTTKMVGIDQEELEARAEEAGATGDLSAVMDVAGEAIRAAAIPSAISTLIVVAVLAFIVNALNKSDPQDNIYGPATLGDS